MTSKLLGPAFPSEPQCRDALDTLKPAGIMSKAYDKFQIKIFEREESINKDHLITKTKHVKDLQSPTHEDQSLSYFNAKTKHTKPSTYDRINKVQSGYNQHLHRDDREHAKSRGLQVNSEERQVHVPTLSSSMYGHPKRKPLEYASRAHVHVELCKKDFLRLNGANIGADLH